MREKIDFFTADYRDGQVRIGGKTYSAGYFAVHLLNQYSMYQNKNDPETVKRIANEVGLSEKTTTEILRSAFHNLQFVDFYHKYADEETEECREDVTCDHTTDPYYVLVQKEQIDAIFSAFYSLTYREQEVIRSHLGFCPTCHSTQSPKFKPQTFQETAIHNELTSAEAAENIYHKALAKMKSKLIIEIGKKLLQV